MELTNAEQHELLVLIQRVIRHDASIQNYAHGAVQAGSKLSTATAQEILKDAHAIRASIRDIARTLNIEY